MAEVWDRLYEALTEFEYLQARIGAQPGQQGEEPDDVFGLLGDFVEALGVIPPPHVGRADLERLYRVLDGNSHHIKETPRLFASHVYNAVKWEEDNIGRKVLQAE